MGATPHPKVVCWRAREKAIAEMESEKNAALIDGSVTNKFQAGEEAFAQGLHAKATARFSECLFRIEALRLEAESEVSSDAADGLPPASAPAAPPASSLSGSGGQFGAHQQRQQFGAHKANTPVHRAFPGFAAGCAAQTARSRTGRRCWWT